MDPTSQKSAMLQTCLAMNLYRACCVGCDQLLASYDLMANGLPYFAVWYNKNDKFFQWNGDDAEESRQFLEDSLRAVQRTGDNTMYYLSIYPDKEVNYKRAGAVASIPFRLNEFNNLPGTQMAGPGGMNEFTTLIKEMNERQIALTKEIAELKATQNIDWFDRLGGLMEIEGAPQMIAGIAQPVVGGLMGLIGQLTGVLSRVNGVPVQQPAPVTFQQTPAISGIDMTKEFDEQVDQALDRLEQHCNLAETLTLLANFADKNPTEFAAYLNLLKLRK